TPSIRARLSSLGITRSCGAAAMSRFSRAEGLLLGLKSPVCSLRLPRRLAFPFLRGPGPHWETVLDAVFRCAQETRRRGRGRDVSGPGASRPPFPQVAWLDRSCCVPIRAVSAVPQPCIARHALTNLRRAPTPPAADRSARHARHPCKRRALSHFAQSGSYTLRRDDCAFQR